MKTGATVRTSAGLGTAARLAAPPSAHAGFAPAATRPDPIAILERQAADRSPDLVPIRHGRMLASPFAFFRGAAAVMAADLAGTPESGLRVQLCGDAQIANFGLFASPERRLVFDLDDFDETHPGPWEWDLKRLAASLEIAARANGFGRKHRRALQLAAVRAYQDAMTHFARLSELEVWHARVDADELQDTLRQQLKKSRRRPAEKSLTKARTRTSRRAMAKLTKLADGRRRIVADPPLVVPIDRLLPEERRAAFAEQIGQLLDGYRETLQPDRRVLFDRFELVDLARKVVGVGSVGTRCWIALLYGRDSDDPLFLQVKEAGRSVLAEYGGLDAESAHVPAPGEAQAHGDGPCQGRRVVEGQRLMQATTDVFLGWQTAEGIDGARRDFFVRQLADWKGSAAVEDMAPSMLTAYARLCGWTLARAHARSGDRVAIAAYLGDDTTFAHAVAEFSGDYADQNDRDYEAMRTAMRTGRIAVEPDHR
jgi:uncharacterized protein (DUF2252 family)